MRILFFRRTIVVETEVDISAVNIGPDEGPVKVYAYESKAHYRVVCQLGSRCLPADTI